MTTSDQGRWFWPDLVDEFAPAIRSFAASRGCSNPDDVVQEVFATAVEKFPEFDGDTAGLRSLLFTLAYRRIADEHRSRSRSRERLVAQHPPIPDDTPSIEDLITRKEAIAEAKAALRILTARERRVVEMRIVEEASPAEVSRVLGISNGNVRVIQARALTKVRKYLAAGQPRPLASFGLLITFIKSLRRDLPGVGDLGHWIEKVRAADNATPMDAVVSSAAAAGGWLAAGTLKIGLVVSLTTATTLGTVAVASSSDDPAPSPQPAITTELLSPETFTPESTDSRGQDDLPGAVVSPSPESPVTEPDKPWSVAPTIPKEDLSSVEVQESTEGPIGVDVADPAPVADSGSEAGIAAVVETTVTVVEETVELVVDEAVEPLIDDVLVPVVTETIEVLVDDVVDPLIEETVEPVVEDVVTPVVGETKTVVEPVVDEIVEPVVEDVTEVAEEAVDDVTDLLGSTLGGFLGG